MSVVQFSDIVALAQPTRPILPSDQSWIEGKIFEAEVLLATRRGDLQTWIDAGPTGKRKPILIAVVNRMIQRVVKNPDGLFTESDGNYSYGRDKSLGSGEVRANEDDWAMLGMGSNRRLTSYRMGLPSWSPRNASSCG